MSDKATETPRTDAHLAAQKKHTYSPTVSPDFARTLERELAQAEHRERLAAITLNASNKLRDALRAEVERLRKEPLVTPCNNPANDPDMIWTNDWGWLHRSVNVAMNALQAEVERLRLKITNPVTGSILDNSELRKERDAWREDACDLAVRLRQFVYLSHDHVSARILAAHERLKGEPK